jgi:uncharacterized coiled-coil DUF342 family protein
LETNDELNHGLRQITAERDKLNENLEQILKNSDGLKGNPDALMAVAQAANEQVSQNG